MVFYRNTLYESTVLKTGAIPFSIYNNLHIYYFAVLPPDKVFRWNTCRVGGCCYRRIVPPEQKKFGAACCLLSLHLLHLRSRKSFNPLIMVQTKSRGSNLHLRPSTPINQGSDKETSKPPIKKRMLALHHCNTSILSFCEPEFRQLPDPYALVLRLVHFVAFFDVEGVVPGVDVYEGSVGAGHAG